MDYDYYNDIKNWYDWGWQDEEDLKIYVQAEWITPEEYEEITGIEYTP